MLNKQGPGKIDWTDYTWNPISGCDHGCPYCYMLRMEKRFPGVMKPTFHEKRMDDIKGLRKPSKIFVGSSGDMWGHWVDKQWISDVLEVVDNHTQHTFQFLTKNPLRYEQFFTEYSTNAWFGTTNDGTDNTAANIDLLVYSVSSKLIRFVSFEPLLKKPDIIDHQMAALDWIIIGADSTRGAKKPPNEWADWLMDMASEVGTAVWVKDNYSYPDPIKDFPFVKHE